MVQVYYPASKEEENSVYTGRMIFMFRDGDDCEHRFLSNFWPCNVELPAEEVQFYGDEFLRLPAMEFSSTELAYVAWKTLALK